MTGINSSSGPWSPRIKPLAAALAIAFNLSASIVHADGRNFPGHVLAGPRNPRERVAVTLPPHANATLREGAIAPHKKPVQPSPAIPVTTCDETSLRNAVASAMDGDTIDLTALTACQITLTTGSIFVNVPSLNIEGPGADELTIFGGYYSYLYNRIFDHTGAGTLSISGLSMRSADYRGLIANGGCIYSSGSVSLYASRVASCKVEAVSGSGSYALGGAIYSKGNTSLLYSTVSESTAYSGENGAYGGGIFSRGDFTSKSSTIKNNHALALQASDYSEGGGVEVLGNGSVFIYDSALFGNTAEQGGAIVSSVTGGSEIANSTVSGNVASAYVGGAVFFGPVTVANSTVAFNVAGSLYFGAGIYVSPGTTLTAQSSIFSGNQNPAGDSDMDIFFAGAIGGSADLIRSANSAVPGDTLSACPRLSALRDNGGPTLTHALIFGSPGIDAGNTSFMPFPYDQRGAGFVRTFGTSADIGAVEWQGDFGDEIFKSAFETRCDSYP